MNWKTLKNRYPEIWEEVETGIANDLLLCMPKNDIDQFGHGFNKNSRINRIAHNAAFLACDAVRKNKYLIDVVKQKI